MAGVLRRRFFGENCSTVECNASGGSIHVSSKDSGTQREREACLERRITEQQIAIERLTDRVRCSDVWMEEQTATIHQLQDRVSFLEGKLIKGISDELQTRCQPQSKPRTVESPKCTERPCSNDSNDTTDGFDDLKIVKMTNNSGVANGVVQVLIKPVRLATWPVRYAGHYAGYTALAPYRLLAVLFGMLGKVDNMLDDLNGQTVPKMNGAADAVSDMVHKAETIPDRIDGLLDRVQDGPLKQVEGMLSYADEKTLKKVDNLVDLLRVLLVGSVVLVFSLAIRALCQAAHGN